MTATKRGAAPPGGGLPRPLAALLRALLPATDADIVIGDLTEDAQLRPAGIRRLVWLAREVLVVAFWSTFDRTPRLSDIPDSRPPMLSNLLFEFRAAVRSLQRSPGFALAVVATIGIGIAGATTVFALVHGVLLAPLDYPEPDRLVAFWDEGSASKKLFEDLEAHLDSVEHVAAWSTNARVLKNPDGDPELLLGPEVTAGFLDALGYRAQSGRLLTAADSEPGAPPVVVLTAELFERRFGGDPNLLGSTIVLDDTPFTVIGILPPGADLIQEDAELLVPLEIDRDNSGYRRGFYLNLIGRLADGASRESATAELHGALRAIEDEYSFPDGSIEQAAVVSLQERLVGDRRPLLVLLMGAVVLLMLIASVNVGNLNLARQLGRRQEVAVRAALGGGRGRGALFLATESVLLAVAGGAVGVAGATWALGALRAGSPIDLPRLSEVSLSPSVVVFSFAVTAITALGTGVAPGMRAARLDPAQALRPGGTMSMGRRARFVREGLVVVEIALAVVLSAAAGLLGHSLWALVSVDPGFDADNRLLVQVVPPSQSAGSGLQVAPYYDRMIEAVEAMPGVVRAGSVSTPPVRGGGWVMSTELEGVEYTDEERAPLSYWRVVSPGYFHAMGARVNRGRPFAESDVAGSLPVAIVNAAFARERWPDADPLGQRLRIGWETEEWSTVVGVIDDIRLLGPAVPAPATVYRPLAQAAPALERVGVTSQTLVLHTRGEPLAALTGVRETLRGVDPGAPLLSPASLESILSDARAEPRLLLQVLAFFGGAALLLAIVGIVGVVSRLVRERRRELGIRQALGARPSDVLAHCLRRGLALGALGLLIGTGGAVALSPVLSGFLYEISPREPSSLLAVVALLASCVALASWVPSRRAARIHPAEALRGD